MDAINSQVMPLITAQRVITGYDDAFPAYGGC